MRILKFVIVVAIAVCSFASANAQVSIRARIGARPVHHRRVVVVQRPVYQHRVNHHWHHPVRRPYRHY